MNTIESLGFEKNTKVVNGFKPHYRKGNDFLFLIGADFWPGKLYSIDEVFENYNGKVYGILTDKSPSVSAKDWVTAPNLTLLILNPLSIGQWRADGTDIEFIEVASID
jgi:hypothetical protein